MHHPLIMILAILLHLHVPSLGQTIVAAGNVSACCYISADHLAGFAVMHEAGQRLMLYCILVCSGTLPASA